MTLPGETGSSYAQEFIIGDSYVKYAHVARGVIGCRAYHSARSLQNIGLTQYEPGEYDLVKVREGRI
jgi:hypothetical protein